MSLYPQSILAKVTLQKFTVGYFFAIGAAILAGLADVLPKPMLDSNVDGTELNPFVLVTVAFLINAALFSIPRKNQTKIKKIPQKNLAIICVIGTCEVIATIAYYAGLAETSAVNASILNNSETIFSIVLAMVIFREILHKRELTPFAMIVLGTIVAPIGYDLFTNPGSFLEQGFAVGDLLVLASGIFYAIAAICYRFVSTKIDPQRIMQIVCISGGIVSLSLMILFEVSFRLEPSQLFGVLITGVLGLGLSSMFFVIALKYIGTVRTVLIYSGTSLFGVLFSMFYLNESVTPFDFMAIALVISGIYFLRNRISD